MKTSIVFICSLFISILFIGCNDSSTGPENSQQASKSNYLILVEGNDTIPSFYMARFETTQKEFRIFDSAHNNRFVGDNMPANILNVMQILIYCNKRSIAEKLTPCYTMNGVYFTTFIDYPQYLKIVCNHNANGYRLPTRKEWCYAAMGGKYSRKYIYPGSNNLDEVAWHAGNSGDSTHIVGTKAPNELGLYDMAGNVAEGIEPMPWYIDGGLPVMGGCYNYPPTIVDFVVIYGIGRYEVGGESYFGFRVIRKA